MKAHIVLLTAVLALPALLSGETLRLKYLATVEVLDDAGKVVGTRNLKAGTVVSVDSSEASAPKISGGKDVEKLELSDLASITLKPAQLSTGAAQCAALTKKGKRCKRPSEKKFYLLLAA